jgi:hypothetical protein
MREFERTLPRHYSAKKWMKILEDWEKSGLSRGAYCDKKKLSYRTFRSWAKKLKNYTSENLKEKREDEPPGSLKDLFIPLTIDSNTLSNPPPLEQKIEITFAQGHQLCLNGPFNWEIIHSWLTPLLKGEIENMEGALHEIKAKLL